MTFALILLFYWPGSNIASTTNVPGFKTKQDCETAGKAVDGTKTYPMLTYVCVKQ